MKVLTASLGLTSILMVGCTLRSPDITVPITNNCQGQQLNAQQIYSRSKNSVAKIETGDGSGSAFIVSHQDGKTLLMTNSHVLETRDHVNVKFHNGRVFRGKRISDAGGADWEKVEDSLQDIALLQVDKVVGKPIVIANLDPQVGEDVIVIGSPMGVDSSLTKGVVSSMHMDSKIVQVDAPINPGNSGGPIINQSGCLVGMATFLKSDSNSMGFGLSAKVLLSYLKNPHPLASNPKIEVATKSFQDAPEYNNKWQSNDSVAFGDLDHPVTNRLCNKKKTFCIFDLASLILGEAENASYSFSGNDDQGNLVRINGAIVVHSIEKVGNTSFYSFSWADDQSDTTRGYAAMGTFRLEKDQKRNKQGIMTRFRATRSFGSKAPVGVENTSYLFPM